MEIFSLQEEDKKHLQSFIRSGAPGHEVVRAMTLLLKHGGQTRSEVAFTLDVTPKTVTNTCNNYSNFGLERSLKDDPRPGQPIIFDDRIKSKIVALVCSDPPEGFDRWSLDLIKSKVESDGIANTISKEKIRIILQEHDLKPWQQRMWCIPELTPEYIERMENILDIYERGDSEQYPLVCLDEKPIALFEDSRPAEIMEPGQTKKVDYEYIRNGTANVFMAVEPFAGKYNVEVTENRTGEKFAHFLKNLSEKYESAKKITLIMDNLNIHRKSSLEKSFGQKEADRIWEKFEVHYTPKHASWLNQAEIAIGMYARQCLGKTRIQNIEILKKKTTFWGNFINEKAVTINWTFNKLVAREKMGYKGKI